MLWYHLIRFDSDYPESTVSPGFCYQFAIGAGLSRGMNTPFYNIALAAALLMFRQKWLNGHQILSERVNKQCICCIKLSEKFKNIKFSIIVDDVKLDKFIDYNINEYKILEDIINNFHINIDKDLLFSAIQLGELKLWN